MKKKKNNFSYGFLGSNDGNSILQQDRCVAASHLSPSVAWRRSQPWGFWQKDCCETKGAGLLTWQSGQRAVALSGAF